MRVHILAKELNVPSKVIIDKCKAEGISTVKNHMSTLSAGLHATIREWFSEGANATTVETAQRVDLERVRIKRESRRAAAERDGVDVSDDTDVAVAVEEPAVESTTTVEDEAPPAAVVSEAFETESADAEPPAVVVEEAGTTETPADTAPVVEATPPVETEAVSDVAEEAPEPAAASITPAGPQNVPGKAKLQGPRVVRYEAPDHDIRPVPRRQPDSRGGGAGDSPGGPNSGDTAAPGTGARRKGRGSPRRSAGGAGRTPGAASGPGEWRDRDLQERRERLAGATGRRMQRRRSTTGGPSQQTLMGPKTEATVSEPVRMKEFCSVTGLNFMQLFKVLRDEHSIMANVNMTLPNETAQLLALHFGIELTVKPAKTPLDELREEYAALAREHQASRPPVVTMLGHVDHGKTSLLDAIRRTRVAAGEDGGITQHIGAHYLDTPHGTVTFLDTPGHQAFTAMRARGAQLTDVVVLVIAADDGVMPQTVEAINHAKAAGVPIVVALNKIDLGEQNKMKIFGQLAEHGLTPSGDWGGEVDVIETSATTNRGVTELVEHLSELSGLLDLKADSTIPCSGTVIEAQTKPGVGAVVRLLVQEGTLRVGDFVVCGPSFGKVRALSNDRGRRVDSATPSMPVEVWGLDEVPSAGDRLYQVDSLQRAKTIASEIKHTRAECARVQTRKVNTLEEMFKRRDDEEAPELNLIIKADVDGSMAALRQALGDFPSDEVRLTIRHDAVGAVNDSDVLLAAACSGIIVAFRSEVSPLVRRLAEHHGVEIRPYRVIYDVHDDVKKALEGLLAPDQRIEPRATIEVREVFKLSRKAGTIAGSYVTDGVLDRSHLVKVIRNGAVIRENCKLASLRRFKDDVKQVRAGMECGVRLENFDDIHSGDIIESYEIVEVARTL